MTFKELRDANRKRCEALFHPISEWSECDWMTAVAGEVGEAANLIKKRRRTPLFKVDNPTGLEVKVVGHELADAVIYIDILCQRMGINLEEVVREKFNLKSKEMGWGERL